MENGIDINSLKFTTKNIDFSLWIKIRSFLIGFFGRKATLRVFCQKNKIDYPVIPGKHYVLPEKYQIEHNEITYIAKIRDRIIQGIYDEYKRIQQNIDEEIKRLETEILNDTNVLENEKQKLEGYKRKKSTSKDPSELLAVDSWIATSKSAVQNLENDINTKKANCEMLKETGVENIESWKQQIENVSAAEDSQNNDFILNLTRSIIKKLGFKEFTYLEIDFSESIEKIKNGEYHA